MQPATKGRKVSWLLNPPEKSTTTSGAMANEHYPAGKQLLRFRIWLLYPPGAALLTLLFVALCLWAALDRAWAVYAILGGVAVLLVLRTLQEWAVATAATLSTLRKLHEEERHALR